MQFFSLDTEIALKRTYLGGLKNSSEREQASLRIVMDAETIKEAKRST